MKRIKTAFAIQKQNQSLEPHQLSHVITIQQFAESIEAIRRTGIETNFWEDVISHATGGEGWLSPDQREHIKSWCVENAPYLVAHGNASEYEELDRLLKYL